MAIQEGAMFWASLKSFTSKATHRLRRARSPVFPEGVELIEEDLDEESALAAWRTRFQVARQTDTYRAVFQADEPLVTVCIPTADRADVLAERALTSMREQTYRNLQVVVIGDQCEDDTADRVASLADERFSFINLPSRGPYPRPGLDRWMVAGTYPGNAALRRVRGSLVTHLDEDDTFEANRIEILVNALKETESDLVFHPFWWEEDDRSWTMIGNGEFAYCQTGTSMVLYHSWLARVPWDPYAYRQKEPFDWNRFRKFQALGAKMHHVPLPLTRHWKYPLRGPFIAKDGETFLD